MKNPYAAPVVQGIQGAAGSGGIGFVDIGDAYPFDVTIAVANTLLTNQALAINADADFVFRALMFTSVGTFSVRIYDGDQYATSDGLIMSQNLTGTPGDPFPWFPELWYPAGGKILIDIQDTSGSPNNVIELLFIGASRFRLGKN
jgi:hypothetical protein